jgi:hypothetical protein
MATVIIETRTVGDAFGCRGYVTRYGKPVHTTRVFPYGYESQAYETARAWACRNGFPTAAYLCGVEAGRQFRRVNPDADQPSSMALSEIRRLGNDCFGRMCGLSDKDIEAAGKPWELAVDDFQRGVDDSFGSMR